MIEGFRPRGTTSAHLVFGQHYHAGLELYDRLRTQGWEHDDATYEVVVDLLRRTWDREAGKPWDSDHPAKNRHSLIRSVVWYLEEFREDSCTTVVLANGKPAVELSFKFDSGIDIQAWLEEIDNPPSQTYILSGHLDRLATFQGDVYVMDRKTSASALTPHFFEGFNPHNQMSLYTIAGEVIFGTPIRGVIIDGAQIMVGFTRYGRGFTFRTPTLNEEYLSDLEPWLRSAEAYAAAGHWPKNEMSCHNYGGCPFRKICKLDPQVRPIFLRSDFEINPWNPLASR